MKNTENRAKTVILTSSSAASLLLESNETPWAPPEPIQAAPTRSNQHSLTTAPRPYVRKHVKQLSLCSIGSGGLPERTPRTRASTQLMQPTRRLTRCKTQPVSGMSIKELDNNIATLYKMPALSSINEEVDDMFDPFSLVNYEELDDYLMRLKARHKPEPRISGKPVPNTPILEISGSENPSDVIKSGGGTILEHSMSGFSILYSRPITPQNQRCPEFSNLNYGNFGWCCSGPPEKKKVESISSFGEKGRN